MLCNATLKRPHAEQFILARVFNFGCSKGCEENNGVEL